MQVASAEPSIEHLRSASADRRARRARLGLDRVRLGPSQVDIREEIEIDTRIKINVCENQVVMVSSTAIAEARQMFSRVTTHPSIRKIQTMTAAHFGLSEAQLCNTRRTANLVLPRQIAFYLCREHTPRSLPEIGRWFGGRDHTTVLHGMRKIAQWVLKYSEVAQHVAEIEVELGVV